ncbi:MAG TPA: ABC transporter substrate-binding protein [Actinocrinis sp.]|jgi:peptide/nickel transport system substrate-binding protein|uniref:ABC transporter substrate-binding protein n=1 Tax=Actinocrinis sp. TaxID=1920516 RepID=UPI002DDD086B|nr:ABC transporter substrate-binding protein [Actinocrinis sp.]HEV3171534.1 ABC transporter substrate-binding protein [Actinocrinis sp.]
MLEQVEQLSVQPRPRPVRERAVKGGTVTWACMPGFPPAVIFPFTPPERFGTRNVCEFQALMYRPLYWLGRDGEPTIDYDLSIGEEPEWSADGRTVTIRIKPWKWSNGETVCADNVIFWVNMLARKGPRYGLYTEGYFPDNLTSYGKVAEDTVSFTFDRAYSRRWILMNQLTMIIPMPKAWDRTADGPANASQDPDQVEAVYDYLLAENGDMVEETNKHRVKWADSPVWSVVNGPWRLKSYTEDGVVTFVPNEHYSGPNKPYLDEFRQIPTTSDEQEYALLKAGPHGPDGIQVGFLPLSYGVQPDGDPTTGGPNPLGDQYTLVPQVFFNIRFMALNFANPRLFGHLIRQPYIRQALQSCIDQESGARDTYQGYGWSSSGPIPMLPSSELLSPKLRDGRGFWPFDIERARTLLSENGWDVSVTPAVCVRPGTGPGEAGEGIPAGTELSLLLRYAKGRVALAEIMEKYKADAAAAGIELRLEQVYGSVLVVEDGPGPSTPDNPRLWELNCWNGGWIFNYPTGENVFQSGASSNFSNYVDARADELIARTVATDDLDALYEYQEYISEQVPVIFMPNFPQRLFEVAANLRGVAPVNPYALINPENWYYVEEEP